VLYNLEVGPDLKSLAQALQISPASLIEQHYSVIYQVQFIGFLPGFLYLNGLPKSIAYPRKTTPTPKVSRGSVGIGGEQTGIYPQESPGGWHIIGKTPYPLFQPTKKHPCFAKAGDRIEFYPITESEFTTISEGISAKTYKIIPQ
jgi:inhibitor of KinA